MRSIRITLLLMTLVPLSLWSANNYYFQTVDVRDGLADNFVRNITRDSYGYIWISTINGLSRYDGYRFFNYQPQQFGSRTNDVSYIGETADSTLWMICSGELFTYNRFYGTWHKDGSSKLSQIGIKGNMSVFYIDDRNNLWTFTEAGLYYYDYATHQLTHISNYSKTPISHIVSKKNVTIVVTSDYKIYEVALNDKSMTPLSQAPDIPYSRDVHVFIDSHLNLWLYNSHAMAGTQWIFSLNNHEWRQMSEWKQMGHVSVNTIIEDHDGRLWMGTGNEGIYIFDFHKGLLQKQMMKMDAFMSNNSHITCFYLDDNNTLWVGSAKLGIAFVDLNAPNFNTISTAPNEDVSAIIQDPKGDLWIAFDGDGILRESPNGIQTHYSESSHQLSSNIVTSLVLSAKGTVLAGTYGNGIVQFNGTSFIPYLPYYQPLQYVKAMTTDIHGNLWVATVDKGVVKVTPDGQLTNFTSENSSLTSNGITCLACDSLRDIIYIGTSVGVSAYDCKKGIFVPIKEFDQMKGTYVSCIMVCHSSNVWIGSRDGLWVYRTKNGVVDHLTREQGMSHNTVRALARIKNGVWASTDNGLTFISPSVTDKGKNHYRCYPLFDTDGLHNVIFSNNAAMTTTNGNALLGCFSGYVRIQPEDIVTYYPKLQVEFTEIRINGEPAQKTPYRLTIDYGERIGILLSAMIPALSHKIRYFYRFKGEEVWMSAPNNMLYFATLNPGMHLLEVKASLPGITESEIVVLPINVQPPLWLSKPAILLYILLFIGIIYLIYRTLRRQQRRELAIKQLEMNLKKYELEEEKIRFFTNISHDIKTPLTLILAPLEKTLGNNLPAAIRTELDVAWRNARHLYDLVLQLLDFRRLDVGKESLNLKHGDVVSFVRQTIQGFAYYATNKQVDILLELPSTPIEINFDEQKLRRIITNLLSNAIKYNEEHGSVTVTLDTRQVPADDHNPTLLQLVLSIADTGIGVHDKQHVFDRFMQESHGHEQEGSGIGLHIVRQYVDMMGGDITVNDNKPKGTIFTVIIPATLSTGKIIEQVQTHEKISLSTEDDGKNAPPSKLTIMIVEDNMDARLFLQRSLSNEYHVLVAINGKEALRVLEKTENVSIIVSDVMMPVMDGIAFFRHIKQNIKFSHIPVILLTAKSSEENIIEGLREGVSDYITKPFSLEVLRLRIHKILEWSLHVHQDVASGIEINPSEITVSSLDEELIRNVITNIEANIQNEDYSVAQLSSDVGMTRGHLYKKLMAITGKSPLEFMRIIKLKRGKSLIEQGRTNITEVAFMVGLSAKQFTHYFKIMYNVTPSDYLRNINNLKRNK